MHLSDLVLLPTAELLVFGCLSGDKKTKSRRIFPAAFCSDFATALPFGLSLEFLDQRFPKDSPHRNLCAGYKLQMPQVLCQPKAARFRQACGVGKYGFRIMRMHYAFSIHAPRMPDVGKQLAI